MKKCCIFGALEPFGFTPDILSDSIVYAADRGLERLETIGVVPDYIIGDFDSLGYVPQVNETARLITLPCEKDDTDIMSCVRHALTNGADEFFVYGALGARLDHSLANIQIMKKIAESGRRVKFFGNGYYAVAISCSSIVLEGKPGGRVSVFALGERAEGVSLTGLKYPLSDASITSDFPIGVSNEFSGETAKVSVTHGTLLVLCDAS